MYRRRRCHLLLALLLFAASVGAETVAISVRLANGPENEPRLIPLLASIEEGAMDAMFAAGHIVFDIDLGEASESTRFRAIDLARAGGATFLVLIDATFEVAPGRGLVPSLTTVTVVDIESERDMPADPVDPRTPAGAEDKPPGALSLEIGVRAAEHALNEIGEVEGVW
ncbi:MAG: hypothetical protein V3S41_08750 [Spirochaetia bacterium]